MSMYSDSTASNFNAQRRSSERGIFDDGIEKWRAAQKSEMDTAMRDLRERCVSIVASLHSGADADFIVAEAKKFEAYISGASKA